MGGKQWWVIGPDVVVRNWAGSSGGGMELEAVLGELDCRQCWRNWDGCTGGGIGLVKVIEN